MNSESDKSVQSMLDTTNNAIKGMGVSVKDVEPFIWKFYRQGL